MKRIFFLFLLLIVLIGPSQGASLVEGVVYLRDGRTIEYTGRDRIRLPRKRAALKAWRNAYARNRQAESYRYDEIDSVVCWNPHVPEYRRQLRPLPCGWSWLYLSEPRIRAYVYAAKGYSIQSNGGITPYYRQRTFSRSRTAYLLQKAGEEEFFDAGSASRNPSDSFRERLSRYVADDPDLADRIRQSSTSRSKTVLMLRDYLPKHENPNPR